MFRRSRALRLVAPVVILAGLLAGCAGEGGAPRASAGRVLVLGLDGVDPDVVNMLVDEGKLPNFARLTREGASGRLTSPPPLLSPVIWTTVATGRRPAAHGIGHFVTTDSETGEKLPVTSSMRRVPALWNIFSDNGLGVGVVGWWATWPAEPVQGVVVSDHAGYHFLMEDAGEHRDRVVYPQAAEELLDRHMVRPGSLSVADLRPFVDLGTELDTTSAEGAGATFSDDLDHFRWALATAWSYRDLGLEIWREDSPDLALVYIEGVDTTSHLFGHLFRQGPMAGELAEQQSRFGDAVEGMYLLADEIVGDYLAILDEGTTLIVMSDHGFRLGELPTDPSTTRDERRVSEAYHEPEGILFMYGRGVAQGARVEGAGILDLAPTILALAGLPVAEDMPGRVLVAGLTEEITIETIESYGGREVGAWAPTEERQGDAVDEAMLEKLESLGYLGGRSTSNDRNLASMLLRDRRYEEAAHAFAELVRQDPEDAVSRMSYGSALAGLGELEEGEVEIRRALELDPVLVPAHHNLGLVLERGGDVAGAIASYRTALRYSSGYEPSRRALDRLGASAAPVATTVEEQRSAELLAEAAGEIQRGAYDAASALIGEAMRLTPKAAVVYQYAANVAYLRGDEAAAVAALEKALEIEPDNALLRRNLGRLLDDID